MAIPCLWCGAPGHVDTACEYAVCSSHRAAMSTVAATCDTIGCSYQGRAITAWSLTPAFKTFCGNCVVGDTYRARQAQQQAQAPTTNTAVVQYFPPGAVAPVMYSIPIRVTINEGYSIVENKRPPEAVRAERKREGVCPECAHRGEWIAMALICPQHGKFAG